MANNIPDPKENRRFLIAFVLSLLVLGLYTVFYQRPHMAQLKAQQDAARVQAEANAEVDVAVPAKPVDPAAAFETLKTRPGITINTKRLAGSIALQGLRFDDVSLLRFNDKMGSTNPVRLLAPSGAQESYFAEVGVMPADSKVSVPNAETVWTVVGTDRILTDTHPVVVEWNNGAGVTFRRRIAIDSKYMFTVQQTVVNNTQQELTLYPYALISQSHHVAKRGEHVAFEDRRSAVMHTGAIGYLNGELEDPSYDDLKDDGTFSYKRVTGWLGLTGKYWLVSLMPESDAVFDGRFSHQQGADKDHDIFQADLRGQAVKVAPGTSAEFSQRLFAGAKQLDLLNGYENELNIPHFDLAIDFGWLYLLTKPLYRVLHELGAFFASHGFTKSFALALLCMTILVRLLTFPLASKSFRSLAKMKQVGPQMQLLKEQHGHDKVKMQQEVIALYKREKVNPASGCVPMLIQIPIFFALYKVLYISLDMRHQPFWGWINDMSAPDPTSVFNLFGLLPFNPPGFLAIGAWPLLYGFTLWLQQKMQPTPDDPVQRQVMALFPWMFMFLFAQFPAGLVIYYVWSNLLGIVQQYVIKRQVAQEDLVVMHVKDGKVSNRGKTKKDVPVIVVKDDDATN